MFVLFVVSSSWVCLGVLGPNRPKPNPASFDVGHWPFFLKGRPHFGQQTVLLLSTHQKSWQETGGAAAENAPEAAAEAASAADGAGAASAVSDSGGTTPAMFGKKLAPKARAKQ